MQKIYCGVTKQDLLLNRKKMDERRSSFHDGQIQAITNNQFNDFGTLMSMNTQNNIQKPLDYTAPAGELISQKSLSLLNKTSLKQEDL